MDCVVEYGKLAESAMKAKKHAYCPYSGFHVGAALLCSDGSLYTGSNIENAAYSPTCCAERTAVFKAVSEGRTGFLAIAVVSDSDDYVYPCGVCRQVLAEFCADSFPVVCCRSDGQYRVHNLGDLLSNAFRGK